MPTLPDSLLHSAACVAGSGGSAGSFAAMDSAPLLAAVRAIAQLRRYVDQFAALAAGEVAYRSRPELGHQGMAQKAGFVNTVAMIQSVAQVSKHEATRLVDTGTLLAEVEASKDLLENLTKSLDPSGGPGAGPGPTGVVSPEWQILLAGQLTEGELSLDKVDAIRRVMSDMTTTDDESTSTAVAELIASASGQSPEQLFRAARRARDVLDADGIERREKQHRDLRSVRTWWDATGMHCGSWRLAPEDGSLVAEAFQQILSPRRGGPRFVSPAEQKTAEDLINDVRSDEQIAADAFTAMMRLAIDSDPGTLFGSRRPAVRVVVTADRLHPHTEHITSTGHRTSAEHARSGHGYLEARHEPVSMATIDRHICDTGIINIGLDPDGQCVNVGREQRLFTNRQRAGLGIRDGGCRFPECERPPIYCEAHHINPWHAKHGNTDIADGILLCRRHHLLIHNNHWDVSRDRADYLLKPPPDIDPDQTLIPMPSRSPVHDDIRRERHRG